jgi:phasin
VADFAFSYPKFEVPEYFRSFAEQSLQQTREGYARMKTAAEETTDMLEESMETTRESLREVQFKALDIAKANADASFDLARQLLSTNSFADAIQLQTAFARERFEAFMDYSKDVQATLNRVGAQAAKPAKDAFDRVLSMSKAA